MLGSGYFVFGASMLLVVVCGASCYSLAYSDTGMYTNETNISYMCDHFDKLKSLDRPLIVH